MAVADDTVERLGDAALERLLAVNVGAVFRLSRHAIPLMRAAGGGVIVTTSSVHAWASMPANAAYAASKGALVALTRQLALDLAPDGIRVVGVAPGSVDTPMTHEALARMGVDAAAAGFDASGSATAIGRVARPEETAAVLAWLTTPRPRSSTARRSSPTPACSRGSSDAASPAAARRERAAAGRPGRPPGTPPNPLLTHPSRSVYGLRKLFTVFVFRD